MSDSRRGLGRGFARLTRVTQAGEAPPKSPTAQLAALLMLVEVEIVLSDYVFDSEIKTLRRNVRKNQSHEARPIFVFPCGGDEGKYKSRIRFKRYIERSALPAFRNVFCLTAEDIANKKVFPELNLVKQEAMLADICDWIVVFAESVGSFCELGIFSVLQHAAAITTVAVDRKYQYEGSFLNEGPVNEIQKLGYPLSRAFYIDLDNPFVDSEFALFASTLREKVKRSNDLSVTRDRKKINTDETDVRVGSLAHELLDLLNLIGPMPRQDLFDLYCKVKGFKRAGIKVSSTILAEDMKRPADIKIDDVLDLLIACGLVSVKRRAFLGMDTVCSMVKLDAFFMFKGSTVNSVIELNKLRAMVHLRKRSFAKGCDKGDYMHFDGE